VQDETTFALQAAPPAGFGLQAWALHVGGQILAAGDGPPPDAVVWEGDSWADGAYPYTLVVTATNGLAATTAEKHVVIDTAPPGPPRITTPISPTYTGGVTVWVAGSAEPGSTITLRNGGTFTFTAPVDGMGIWELLFPLNAGWNLLRATATDAGGHESGESASVAVQVVVEPPLIGVGITPTLATDGTVLDLWATARGDGHTAGPATRYVTATAPTGEAIGLVNTVPASVGIWTGYYTVTRALANGLHTVRYLGVDWAEVRGEGQTALQVDRQPPAPPLLASPTGSDYTNQLNLAVYGEAEPLARVRVYVDNVSSDVSSDASRDVTANANGQWSVDAHLAEGENRIWAEAWDMAGNRSQSSQVARRTLDTLDPQVSLAVSPFVQAGGEVVVTAAITDASPVRQVLLSLPDTAGDREMALTRRGDRWTTTYHLPPGTAEGQHTARVRAWDAAGNTGQAESAFIVDNTPPVLVPRTLVEHSPYAHVDGGMLYYGAGSGTFTVTALAIDTLSQLHALDFPTTVSPGTTYDLYGARIVLYNHVYTFTAASTFADVASVVAADRAGNTAEVAFTIVRDAASPVAQVTQTPSYVHTGSISIPWTASDTGAGVGVRHTVLWVRFADGPWQESGLAPQAGITGSFDFAFSQGEGRYEFAAVATDHVGNAEAPPTGAGEAWTVYDATPPTAALSALPRYQTARSFTVRWDGSDPASPSGQPPSTGSGQASGLATYDLEVRVDGAAWQRVLTCTQSTSYQFTGLEGRTYAFRVRARDRAGNASAWNSGTTTVDSLPPTSSASTPVSSDSATFLVTWSGSDATSGIAAYDLEVQVDEGAWQRVLTRTRSTSHQFTGLSGHVYSFRCRARDAAGNVESWPAEADATTAVMRSVTKYYYHGGQRVALRSTAAALTTTAEGSVVYYLHADHLGSTSLATYGSGLQVGQVASRQLYHPYGTTRYAAGPGGAAGTLPTDFGFTGQRSDATSLIFMHARYYHPALGRFVSADTVVPVPANPQDWNRYTYVANSPVRSTDPSGHFIFNRPSWMYLVPGLNLYAYAKDCATSVSQAVEAYKAGERRVGALALHTTGAADYLIRQAESTNQLNEDVDIVFSNASFEERLPHAMHLGVWATGKAAEIVGAAQVTKAGIEVLKGRLTLTTMGPNSDEAIQIAEQALANGRSPAPSGYYDVLSHGTPYRMTGPQGQSWNAKQVSEWILAQSDYTAGQPVRLVSCWTGRNANGIAQGVANELGAPVLGATTRVWAETLIPKTVDRLGAVWTYGMWRLFTPQW
jgi:RHS repeat-associated protein